MTGRVQERLRRGLGVAGWVAVAATAVAVGLVAVRAISSSIVGTSTTTVTAQQVDRALAQATPSRAPSVKPSPSTATVPGSHPASSTAAPTRTPRQAATTRVLATRGGSVIARCVGGQAAMLSWSPAQGFEVEDVAAGPATTVTLTFEADTTEIGVRVDCQNQIPTVHVTTRADSDSDSD